MRNFEAIARDGQIPPDSNWATWLCCGDRGSGRSRACAEWLLSIKTPSSKFALVASNAGTLRIMIDELIGRSVEDPAGYVAARYALQWESGALACGFVLEGDKQLERIRGLEFNAAWGDNLFDDAPPVGHLVKRMAYYARLDETLRVLRTSLRQSPRQVALSVGLDYFPNPKLLRAACGGGTFIRTRIRTSALV